MIGLGSDCGVDWAFSQACDRLGVAKDVFLADFSHLGDYRFANRELIRRGPGLCIIVHRTALDEGSTDLAQQAIAAGVPTYLIDNEQGTPKRLNERDEILRLGKGA